MVYDASAQALHWRVLPIMSVLFVGKRFYTNRDALRECFGRIYQLPLHWAQSGISTQLWLVDYHTRELVREQNNALDVISLPALGSAMLKQWLMPVVSGKYQPLRPHTVVASGDCYIGLMAYWFAKRIRARFVFDVYDKYDEFEGYRRLPGFDPYSFLLNHAGARLFASQALMGQAGLNRAPNYLVPNGIDTQYFRSYDLRESRQECGLPTDAVFVGYFGSMEPDRGVDDLVSAINILRNSGMKIELLLGGVPSNGFDLSRQGIHYVGNVPFKKIPKLMACCNLLAVPYRRSAFMDAGASNKIAESIACARPLVATRTPNLMSNFPEQSSCLEGLLANPSDSADMARVIHEQLEKKIIVPMPRRIDWPSIATTLANQLDLASH